MKGICSVPGCGKPARRREWCGSHYDRWRLYGDPLGGSTGWGEAQRYFRDVVLTYDGNECHPWPFSKNGAGYGLLFTLRTGSKELVSRLVCEQEYGPAPSIDHVAAHSCGNGHLSCCTKRHLSWKTRVGNADDSLLHGTRAMGEKHGRSRITEADVRSIRALGGSISQRAIGELFGISQGQIGRIIRGEKWKHLVPLEGHPD